MAELNVSILMKLIDGVTAPVKRIGDALKSSEKMLEHYNEKAEKMFKEAAAIKLAGEGLSEVAHFARELAEVPIEQAEKFQVTVLRMGAVAGRSADSFGELAAKITEMSAGTEFSANQVATSLGAMQKSGMNVNTAMVQMPKVMEFASAQTMDLAEAASLTASVMKGFKVPAEQTEHVTDLLTVASRAAGVGVTDFGMSLAQLGPTARLMGVSLDSAAGIIGVLGQAGLQGERGASALNAIMTRLAAPKSLKKQHEVLSSMGINALDAKKNLKDLPTLMQEIAEKSGKMGNAEKLRKFGALFGREAAASVASLFSALKPDQLTKLTTKIKESEGATKEMSHIMDQSAEQARTKFKASLETLQTTLGTALLPSLTKFLDLMTSLLTPITNFAARHTTLTSVVMTGAAAFGVFATAAAAAVTALAAVKTAQGMGLLTTGFGKLTATLLNTSGLNAAMYKMGQLTGTTYALNASMMTTLATFGSIALAVGAVGLAVAELVKHWHELDTLEAFKGMWDSVKDQGVLNTLADLTDVTGLANDLGLGDDSQQSTESGLGPAEQTLQGGATKSHAEVTVKVEGPGTVTDTKTNGPMKLNTEYGLAGASP